MILKILKNPELLYLKMAAIPAIRASSGAIWCRSSNFDRVCDAGNVEEGDYPWETLSIHVD